MIYKSTNLATQCTKVVLAVFAIWISSLLMLTCTRSAEEEMKPQLINSLQVSPVKKTAESLIIQPGDTIYRPIAWGSELRVVPNIIYQGNHRKYGRYWFCKTMAYQVVKPANYQQDSVRERVEFADSVLITNTDTFYICRRVIY